MFWIFEDAGLKGDMDTTDGVVILIGYIGIMFAIMMFCKLSKVGDPDRIQTTAIGGLLFGVLWGGIALGVEVFLWPEAQDNTFILLAAFIGWGYGAVRKWKDYHPESV